MDISIGILFGIIAMISWGASDILIAKASRRTGVLKTVIWSQITGLILYTIIFSAFFRLPALSQAAIGLTLITGLLSAIGYMTFAKGLKIGKVSIISPIVASWSVITISLSIIFLGETLTALQAAGASLAILGTILASFRLKDLMRVRLKNSVLGIKYAIISALLTGVYFFFFSILISELGWFLPAFFVKITIVLYLLSYSATTKNDITPEKNIIQTIIMIGILESAGFLAYSLGVVKELTSIVASVSAAYPMIAIILARILFNENLDISQKIGIITVLSGIILLSL